MGMFHFTLFFKTKNFWKTWGQGLSQVLALSGVSGKL